MNKGLKVGIVLEGGVKEAFQTIALRASDELKLQYDCVSQYIMGALNAALYHR